MNICRTGITHFSVNVRNEIGITELDDAITIFHCKRKWSDYYIRAFSRCNVNLNQTQMAVMLKIGQNLLSSQIYGGAESVLLDLKVIKLNWNLKIELKVIKI